MKTAAFFCNNGPDCPEFNRIFNSVRRARIEAQCELYPHVITSENFSAHAEQLNRVDAIFATWGMWELSPAQLAALPNLRAVFYAAGSVRYFAGPLLERDILVTSSWLANAIPVAEFTLAQILLANKGYWCNIAQYREREDYDAFRGRGNYGATVALLGAGGIGRRVIELLRPFQLRVVCFDPFLSHKGAEVLGVEKVELAEAFSRGHIVSNHLADVPETVGILNGKLFHAMPRNATFINTGRGATVNHEELLNVMSERLDLTALLDVTEPEPLPLPHPLRTLPNVHLTSHIAGSIGDEVERMGDVALQEFERWNHGEPLRHAITTEMLESMA